MNCDEATRLLSAHLDGELDLEKSLAIEEHIARCVPCRNAWNGHAALRRVIARSCEPAQAPAALRERVRASLSDERAGPPSRRNGQAWLPAIPGVAALLAVGWLAWAQPWQADPTATLDAMRVVYHIAGAENFGASLRTLKNHLDAEPGVRVVVVAHNNGVEFLLRGARDETGRAYAELVRDFRERGVEFRVCTNTLTRRQIDPAAVIQEAALVPSGIAEIGRLQSKEGYVYLRL